MSDKKTADENRENPPHHDATRRRFLAGAGALGVAAGVAPAVFAAGQKHQPAATSSTTSSTTSSPTTPAASQSATCIHTQPLAALPQAEQDALLRKHIKNVVVIYAENRSFNNLFANFPGVEKPLADLQPADYQQRDRDGTPLQHLPPVWKGMVPHEQEVQHVKYKSDENDPLTRNLPNQPFMLQGKNGEYLPHGVVTRDLWHVFYQNQMQINHGKNDRFVAWADSGALPMGYYGDSAWNLRLWTLAQEFTLCDNFFQGAFGGSFLNHQYLICAKPPFYPNVQNSPARTLIAQLESDDPADPRLKPLPDSPASALQGMPLFGKSQITPDGYAVNTMAPPFSPSWQPDASNPALAASKPEVMPPQHHTHIGDLLSQKGLDWAWYAGGWQFAVDGGKDSATFPGVPDFQYHHQPFNYFANLAPDHASERAKHLRDGGLGDTAATNKFLAAAEAGTLPPVAFYKPQGNLNMHAGYSDVEAGDRHIAHIISKLRTSPQWANSVVIITFDENGGWWDHVAPPQGDRWGPGSRIPALIISPFARRGFVDHTLYDTGSILRFISRLYDLPLLDGLKQRNQAMTARGQQPPGDLTHALAFPL